MTMKGIICILLAAWLLLAANAADAATKTAKPRVNAPAKSVDLLLHDSGWYVRSAGAVDLELATAADEAMAVVPAPTPLGLALGPQVMIGLDFRHSAVDENRLDFVSSNDVVETVTDNLVLGFQCKF